MTRVEGRSQDPVLGVPVGCLGIVTDEQRRQPSGAPDVFRYRGVGDAEVVERHVALAQVMPLHRLVEIPEFVADRRPEYLGVVVAHRAMVETVVADAGDRIPVAEMEIEDVVGRADGVEQTEVVELLVEVVNVLGQQCPTPALEIALGEEAARALHQLDQLVDIGRHAGEVIVVGIDQPGNVCRWIFFFRIPAIGRVCKMSPRLLGLTIR